MIFAEAKVCRYCKRTFTEAEIKNALELEKNYLPYTDKTKVNVFINKSDYFDNGKIICPICKIFSPPHFKKCNNCGVGFFITKSNQK